MIESLILAANVTANSALPSAAATNIFSEGTVNFLLPFYGSAVCGFFMAYALKKILKWAFIILGVLAGPIFLIIQYLHVHGYIGSIDWAKLGSHIAAHLQTFAAQVDFNNVHSIVGELGLPLSGGFGVGILAGLMKR
jgi:uncharacterized membrane protein (Fun14 family)